MIWTDILPVERASHVREGSVAGCALSLVYSVCGRAVGVLLSLDRAPATYTRTITTGELLALARLNPEDEPPAAARPVISDLMLALAALRRDGMPLGTRDRIELGRVASALAHAAGLATQEARP